MIYFLCVQEANAGENGIFFQAGKNQMVTDGNNCPLEEAPFFVNERLYVPLRALAMGMGITENNIIWDAKGYKLALINGNDIIVLDVKNNVLKWGKSQYAMDLPLIILNDRIFVPVRFMAEKMGYKVQWSETEQGVWIKPTVKEAESWEQERFRHVFIVDKFMLTGGEDTIGNIHNELNKNNIYFSVKSIEQIMENRNKPGETVLCHEKMLGEARIVFKEKEGDQVNNENAFTCLGYLNNTTVNPGDIFSFNETAGPYTEERGYISGYAFVGNKVVTSIGGGACRASSLLYNAVLEASLPVIERHPHSMPVYYVPTNRDATIWYGSLDFRFRNDCPFPLGLRSATAERTIYISIWGIIN